MFKTRSFTMLHYFSVGFGILVIVSLVFIWNLVLVFFGAFIIRILTLQSDST
jgi:hypothetical protein